LRNYIKKSIYIIVFSCFFPAIAGSFDDFFKAIKQDDDRTVAALLRRGFDPNTRDPQGLCGLFLALREPSLKVADVLLQAPQTDVNLQTGAGENPLMMAALKNLMPQALRLIERDADVNKPGWTPLHYAATGGHSEMIRLLLDNHAYIDAESPNRSTPLMMASSYGNAASVKLLLDEGADPMLVNEQGLTAVDFARRAGREDVVILIAAAARARQPQGKW
jgi:ankyrin repeat protein